jgi:RND family efflux transporter MFP subunit
LFDEGQTVTAGQVLVKLDVALLTTQRDAAAASVQSAQAMVRQAQARQQNWAREDKRMTDLYENHAVSEKEYNDVRTELEIADAEIELRSAELAQKQAELQRLNQMLEKSVIRSPFDGVVGRRSVEVGQWLKQGDTVAELVQLDPLFVRVGVPEELIARVAPGTAASVAIPAMPGLTLEGKVDQILPEADVTTRTFPVRIRVENKDQKVRPGFFATIILKQEVGEGAFVVPRDAIVLSGTDRRVVAVRDSAAVLVPVTLLGGDGQYEVVSGELKDGDVVVTRGNEMLMTGQGVIVTNQPPATSAPATQPPQAEADGS